MSRNNYGPRITLSAMVRMFVAVVVFVVLIVPFRADALDYYQLAINHGNSADNVYHWANNIMDQMGEAMQSHNPNSSFFNTSLSSWRSSEDFFKFLDTHIQNAANNGQVFYANFVGHGSTGRIGTGSYGGWGGVPVGRAQTLNHINQRTQELGIPAYVYDGSCGSALCVDASRNYFSNDSSSGLQGVMSSGDAPRGYAVSTWIGPNSGPEAAHAAMWRNLDALDKDGKGYLTLGEALEYMRPLTKDMAGFSADGVEGLDTPYIGKECFIGGPRDTCVVVAPGWSAKDETGKVVKDSIPDSPHNKEYGTCWSNNDLNPDCPDLYNSFNRTQNSSPNYPLYHRKVTDEGGVLGSMRTLKYQYESAKDIVEEQFSARYKEEQLEDVKILYVVPDKTQAQQFVDSGFKRYEVNGISVKPGAYAIDMAVNINPTEGQWEGVRAKEANGECTFEVAQEPPPPPTPDPSTGGNGPGSGGPGSGGSGESLLPILAGMLSSLFGQGQQQSESVTQDPDQDLPPELPDYIVGCPEDFDPVCAIDGRTYFNECVAAMEEKPIAESGFCPSDESTGGGKPSLSLIEQMMNALESIRQRATNETTTTEETIIP